MKVYLLYYGYEDDGSREACSIYYTPTEIFDTSASRKARIKVLKKLNSSLYFEEQDFDILTLTDINNPIHNNAD